MNSIDYKKFQRFQNHLVKSFIDTGLEFEIDTVFGNELFQRCADAAFKVYEKYSTSDSEARNDLN